MSTKTEEAMRLADDMTDARAREAWKTLGDLRDALRAHLQAMEDAAQTHQPAQAGAVEAVTWQWRNKGWTNPNEGWMDITSDWADYYRRRGYEVRALYAHPPKAVEPQKLWLWKNGPHEYWAFDNPFPIHLDNDDPQTLGEPCGYALLKPSRTGRIDIDEAEVMRRIRESSTPAAQPEWVPSSDTLRNIIRARIAQSGKSQMEYATKMGYSPQYLSDFLNGRREPGEAILSAENLRAVTLYVKEKGHE